MRDKFISIKHENKNDIIHYPINLQYWNKADKTNKSNFTFSKTVTIYYFHLTQARMIIEKVLKLMKILSSLKNFNSPKPRIIIFRIKK